MESALRRTLKRWTSGKEPCPRRSSAFSSLADRRDLLKGVVALGGMAPPVAGSPTQRVIALSAMAGILIPLVLGARLVHRRLPENYLSLKALRGVGSPHP